MRRILRECRRTTSKEAVPLRAEVTSGFTLVELLVVLGIVSVVTALLLPALGGVRRQARTLVSVHNMREIVAAADTFASDGDGKYPLSVAIIGTEDNWNWQAPNMLTGYLKRTPSAHRSVGAYLRPYIDDANVLFCPNAPIRYRYLQEVWDAGDDWNHPDTDAMPDPMFGTYCLYWNYVGYRGEGQSLFRGPAGPGRGRRESTVLISDYLGYDHWRSPQTFGSCEVFREATVVDGTTFSSAFWSSPGDGTLVELQTFDVKLHAGYADGHVESYAPAETQPMEVILHPETGEPYEPGTGAGTFYLPRAGLR